VVGKTCSFATKLPSRPVKMRPNSLFRTFRTLVHHLNEKNFALTHTATVNISGETSGKNPSEVSGLIQLLQPQKVSMLQ
jgi:hypothetical protein